MKTNERLTITSVAVQHPLLVTFLRPILGMSYIFNLT
jgi:hypothetical protein